MTTVVPENCNLTCEDRLNRLDTFIREGRILRKKWRDIDSHGRERACFLVALVPEVGATGDISKCPADVMPQWLANLIPSIDDCGTEEHWPIVVKRYASLARRAFVLTESEWQQLDYKCRAIAVREAYSHVTTAFEPIVWPAIKQVLVLLDNAGNGQVAKSAAWGAAKSAAGSAARACLAGSAARNAAKSAAVSAARAGMAGSAVWSAVWSAAESAAWDRMIDKWFDAFEAMIQVCEQRSK